MVSLPMLRILVAASCYKALGALHRPYIGLTPFINLPWPGGRPKRASSSRGSFTQMVLLDSGENFLPCKKAVEMSLVKTVIPIMVARSGCGSLTIWSK